MSNKICFSCITLLLLLICVDSGLLARPTVIKFATVAPRNSGWMRCMLELDSLLQAETDGEVRFKFYPGGVQGDERDVLRKIHINQLHAGGFTGVGMGAIFPDSRILDIPFMFRDTEEVDLILTEFGAELAAGFSESGFQLLGWTEVGMVHFFTNSPVTGMEDLRSIKLWVWQDDPVARTFFREMSVSPVPLALTDVLSSFETGIINGAYASPYGAAVLQWHTRVSHVSQKPVACAAGAILISNSQFGKLTPRQQGVLLKLAGDQAEKIILLSRSDNATTLAGFSAAGLEVGPPLEPENAGEFEEAAAAAQLSLAGELYSLDLYSRIRQRLQAHRTAE